MKTRALYLGDTSLDNAAAYLSGLMTHWGWEFDYVPSNVRLDGLLLDEPHDVFVLSDYPAEMLDAADQQKIAEQVERGTGLVMLGGWESFHGLGGNWDGTLVSEVLPVQIDGEDDRVNCDRPLLVAKTTDHPTVAGLPWEERPPLIGGYNRFTPNPSAQVVLESFRFNARRSESSYSFTQVGTDPLLVVGEHGNGRTAALATDVAPHWVGPLVDWGEQRVTAQAVGAESIEVGDLYATFFRQLLGWAAKA